MGGETLVARNYLAVHEGVVTEAAVPDTLIAT
jgi:hypothetical protein